MISSGLSGYCKRDVNHHSMMVMLLAREIIPHRKIEARWGDTIRHGDDYDGGLQRAAPLLPDRAK